MNSNELFMYLAPRCLFVTLAINAILAIISFFGHKRKLSQRLWYDLRFAMIGLDSFLAACFFMIAFLVPNSIISGFLPTIPKYETVVIPAEVIEVENIIEKENIIEVPSIILPLRPEGNQAIVIDTSSKELGYFMKSFYGENVNFFNERQQATYLYTNGEFQNYTELNLNDIQYKDEENASPINLNKLGYETIWLFTDLKNIQFEAVDVKVVMYVPHTITKEQLENLKTLGDVTVITIEEVR